MLVRKKKIKHSWQKREERMPSGPNSIGWKTTSKKQRKTVLVIPSYHCNYIQNNSCLFSFRSNVIVTVLFLMCYILKGLERMITSFSENPSFSNKKNLEETEQLLDEVGEDPSLWRSRFLVMSDISPCLQTCVFSFSWRPIWNWTFLRPLNANYLPRWLS